MRCLRRNKRKFSYALYTGNTMAQDADGNLTGELTKTYSDPVTAWGNVSAGTGSAAAEIFGDSVRYDRVIVLDNTKFPVTETSKVWIDGELYIVTRVAKSINSVSIAVRKADTREEA